MNLRKVGAPVTNSALLERCPFCDGDSLVKLPNDYASAGNGGQARLDAFYVHCEGCGCDGPVAESEGEAVAAWNQRARRPYQARVLDWSTACFGAADAEVPGTRPHRFLEEALELVQALGCPAEEAQRLLHYVYGRPKGDPDQEVGGVMITLAALCHASRLDMADAGERELKRVWVNIDRVRAKSASKPSFTVTRL